MVLVQLDESHRGLNHAAYLPDINDSKVDDEDAMTACTQTSTGSNASSISLYTYKLPDGTVTTSSTVPILKDGERVTIRRKRPSTSGKKKNTNSNSLDDTSSHHSRTSTSTISNLVPISEEDRDSWKANTSSNPAEVVFDFNGSFVGNNNGHNHQPPDDLLDAENGSFVNVNSSTNSSQVTTTTSNKKKGRQSSSMVAPKKISTGTDYDQYDFDECLKLEGDFDDRYERMIHRTTSNGPKNVFINPPKGTSTAPNTLVTDGPVPLRTSKQPLFSRSAAAGGSRGLWFGRSSTKSDQQQQQQQQPPVFTAAKPYSDNPSTNTSSSSINSRYKDNPRKRLDDSTTGSTDGATEPEDDFLQEVSLDPHGNGMSSTGNGRDNNNSYYSDIEYHSDVLHRHNRSSNSRRQCRYCWTCLNGCIGTICDSSILRRRSMKCYIGTFIAVIVFIATISTIAVVTSRRKEASTLANMSSDEEFIDYTNNGKDIALNDDHIDTYPNLDEIYPPLYIDSGHDGYTDRYVPGRIWVSDDEFLDPNDEGLVYYGCDLFDLVRMDLLPPTCNTTTGQSSNEDDDDVVDDDVTKTTTGVGKKNCTTANTTTLSSVQKTRDQNGDYWDPEIFCTERWFKNKGLYEIPVPNEPATYSVKMYFNELYYNNIGDRVFDITVESKLLKNNFDIVKAAGGKYTVVYIQSYHIVDDGLLTIELTPSQGVNTFAKINAITVQMIDPNPKPIDPNKTGIVGTIDHPAFVLKPQTAKGDLPKDTTDNNNDTNSSSAAPPVTDDFVLQIDDNYKDEIENGWVDSDGDGTVDAEPSFAPTSTNFPTFWIPDSEQVSDSPGDDNGTGTDNTNNNDGSDNHYNKYDENSVHINVGQGVPNKRSNFTKLMWFDDEMFITSAEKGTIVGNCDGTKRIRGMEEFALDPDVGCHERVFDHIGVYEIPLPVNIEQTITFNVTLYFAETFFHYPNERVFDIFVEDKLLIDNLDIIKETNGEQYTLFSKSVITIVEDGLLSIELVSRINDAKINAIVVKPTYQPY